MNSDSTKCVLLGVIATLLGVLVFGGFGVDRLLGNKAFADSGAVDGVIALIGGKNNDDLFLVDVKNQRIAAYEWDKIASKLSLKAARNFSYDLQCKIEISSKSGMSVSEARDELIKESKKIEKLK